MFLYLHIHVLVYMYDLMYVCIYACIHIVCMHVCVFVRVYMYNCMDVYVLISEYAGKEQMSRSLGKVTVFPAVRSGVS